MSYLLVLLISLSVLVVVLSVLKKRNEEIAQQLREKISTEKDLEIAAIVQEHFIPPPLIENDEFLIRSFYRPAAQCGGDFWDYFSIRNHHYIFIADVMGHGYSPALISSAVKGALNLLQKMARGGEKRISPSKIMDYIHQVVFDSSKGQTSITCFIGAIDTEKFTLTYANAGHPAPWVFGNKRSNYISLNALSPPLWDSPNAPHSEEHVRFSKEDLLFLYTDGLLEAKNPSGATFGRKKIYDLIRQNLSSGGQVVIERLIGKFLEFNADKQLDDDVTAIACEYKNR